MLGCGSFFNPRAAAVEKFVDGNYSRIIVWGFLVPSTWNDALHCNRIVCDLAMTLTHIHQVIIHFISTISSFSVQ